MTALPPLSWGRTVGNRGVWLNRVSAAVTERFLKVSVDGYSNVEWPPG